ncbi:hypothetical protein A7J57_22435 [Agrobacterium tumefaciens]|uniref:Uncharacterized protein n=1 Tax=Agrobacterium tumefaciens TaxID=358 RepID=A0A176XHV2_AGRTU|nr:hypothetical protein A7J57_22435 [Agrobacterium tumefaciens]
MRQEPSDLGKMCTEITADRVSQRDLNDCYDSHQVKAEVQRFLVELYCGPAAVSSFSLLRISGRQRFGDVGVIGILNRNYLLVKSA